MLQRLQQIQDEKEQKRAAEWAAREQRINNAMSRMADTVVKKQDLAEKQLAERIRQHEQEKNLKDQQEEERRKRRQLQVNEELQKSLKAQLDYKQKARKEETI